MQASSFITLLVVRGASTHVVGSHVVFASNYSDGEIIILEKDGPSHESPVARLVLLQVEQGLMIRLDGEPSPIHVWFKLLDAPYNSKTLFLDGRIIALWLVQPLAGVCHRL